MALLGTQAAPLLTSRLRIGIDASPISHGSRAIRRYVLNLLRTLLEMDSKDEYRTFWINPPSGLGPGLLPAHSRHRPCVTRLPGRFLSPLWKYANTPPVEWLTGKVDLFHATQLEAPSVRHTPALLTIHGLAYLAEPGLLDSRFVSQARDWHERAIRRCSWFIAVSEHTRRTFVEAHPWLEHRCRTIPLGVGSEFTPEGPGPQGLTRPYILYVGAVARHKNVHGIVAAYDLLRERRQTDALLVLAGPVDEAFWASLPAGRFRGDVVRTGLMSQDGPALAALYRGAQAFVFPSFYEGWASPPLEAMASGVPVVVSNVSSLPETVGDAALQVDPNDVESIAEGIRAVLEESAVRQGLVARGRARAAQFTWDRMARATLALYREAAA